MQENSKFEQQKKEFQSTLSMFSHEIRNPLALITSELQMLSDHHPQLCLDEHWDNIMENLNYIRGLLGNVISVLVELKSMDFAVSAGASGAVFAVMGAMIYIVIRNKGWLGDLSARQILVMAFFSLYYGFTSTGVDNTAHVAGLVCGIMISILLYHPRGRRI